MDLFLILFFISQFLYFIHCQTCSPTSPTNVANSCCTGDLSLASTVTSIVAYAYFNCGTITSVTIPETVVSVGIIKSNNNEITILKIYHYNILYYFYSISYY